MDAILQRNPLLHFPVPTAPKAKPVVVRTPVHHAAAACVDRTHCADALCHTCVLTQRPSGKAGSAAGSALVPAKRAASALGKRARDGGDDDDAAKVFDLWDDTVPEAAPAAAAAATAAKRPKPPRSRHVAVPLGLEVCHAGASYRPPDDAHQELLAKAVAVEHMKLLKAELKPVQPPALGAVVAAQLAHELLCAGDDDEEDDAADGLAEQDGGPVLPRKAKRVSKADRNRAIRARLLQDEADRMRLLKAQRRDVQNLEALQKQLQESQAATAERAARRAAARAERAASEPSRLGKRRFSAAPIAVALSEELHGSMRRVVPVATLLSDRYVALQRDEKIEPRVAARYVRSKSYMLYEPGSRGTKELEMHAETQQLRKKTKEATKEASRAKASAAAAA